jgi:glycosyltransferase involved in cell wall biosynthesis
LADLGRSSLSQVAENLFVFRYPLWAPISGRFPLKQFTQFIRQQALNKVLCRLNMAQPIVWFLRPDMIDLIEEIPSARLFLYHCEDEYTSYHTLTPDSRRRIEASEHKLMAQVDAVIVVSQKLCQAKKPFNPQTWLVPNGVNYQAYATALADPQLPGDLQAISRPRLGYSGYISDKLNLIMLKELAQAHPHWSLVFLGEVGVSGQQAEVWRTLQTLPNVHHIGPVEWSQVPHYVKGFDVGLLPYVQDDHSENISPMKLYDYLAAGLPVVSVDIPAAREFSQYIHFADNPQCFSQAVQAALADKTAERRQARLNLAAQHSWQARAEQISNLIQTQLMMKPQKVGGKI